LLGHGLLLLIQVALGNPVGAAEPIAGVDHPAAVGTKRKVGILRAPLHGALADGAAGFSHAGAPAARRAPSSRADPRRGAPPPGPRSSPRAGGWYPSGPWRAARAVGPFRSGGPRCWRADRRRPHSKSGASSCDVSLAWGNPPVAAHARQPVRECLDKDINFRYLANVKLQRFRKAENRSFASSHQRCMHPCELAKPLLTLRSNLVKAGLDESKNQGTVQSNRHAGT